MSESSLGRNSISKYFLFTIEEYLILFSHLSGIQIANALCFPPRTTIFVASTCLILFSLYAFHTQKALLYFILLCIVLLIFILIVFLFVAVALRAPFSFPSLAFGSVPCVIFNFVYAQLEHIFEISSVSSEKFSPHIWHYSDGRQPWLLSCHCPGLLLESSSFYCRCRCRFPMSTFIYANLISILNAVCVYGCVWGDCVCTKNSLCLGHFGLILLTLCWCSFWWVAQVFFRYCFLSALISEWAVAILPSTPLSDGGWRQFYYTAALKLFAC